MNIYLDVDGVLNPIGEPNPEWSDWVRLPTGFFCQLSTELGDTVNALQAEIVWLTTWEQDNMCNEIIGAHLGWDEKRVIHRHFSLDNPWWKLLRLQEEPDIDSTPFIWIDDDINYYRDAYEAFGQRDDVLMISPQTEIGITKDHIERITAHLEQWK